MLFRESPGYQVYFGDTAPIRDINVRGTLLQDEVLCRVRKIEHKVFEISTSSPPKIATISREESFQKALGSLDLGGQKEVFECSQEDRMEFKRLVNSHSPNRGVLFWDKDEQLVVRTAQFLREVNLLSPELDFVRPPGPKFRIVGASASQIAAVGIDLREVRKNIRTIATVENLVAVFCKVRSLDQLDNLFPLNSGPARCYYLLQSGSGTQWKRRTYTKIAQ